MAEIDRIPEDEWRLDDEPAVQIKREPALTPVTTAIATNLSHERLARPVYVVTAEHLAWYIVAIYAVVTRVIALGARPVDPAPAANAFAAFLIAGHGRAALALSDASWVAILQAWIFGTIGATDASSRIVVMLCGLILVAIGFAMRDVLGRAGALAFAALIAISPSMTYFSRGGSTAIASVTLMMVAIAIAESMRRHATILRAAVLGVAIAMWLSVDPIGYLTAAPIVVSLILVGLVDLVRTDHRSLRMRVWWNRRRAHVIVCAVVALLAWLELTTAFLHRPLITSVMYYFSAAFAPPRLALFSGLHTLIPILGFYEFAVVALAMVGALAIVVGRTSDRFGVWAIVWAIVSIATYIAIGTNRSATAVAIVLPLALLSAYGLDWMHQSERWNSVRYAIAALAALTIYVQIAINFVYPAPDVSEAPWRRHALLFWSEPATTVQTISQCERARNEAPAGATAFLPDDAPQLQWYLRDFTLTDSATDANIVVTVGKIERGSVAGNPDSPEFGYEEWWIPDFHAMSAKDAIAYLFMQRTWSDVEIRNLQIAKAPGKPNP